MADVTLGSDGLFKILRRDALLLDTSSCEPWLTMETAAALAEQGIGMMAAPFSGAEAGADRALLARVTPLLEIMGKIFHLGPVASGHAMKCINNLITSITFLATAEGLAADMNLPLPLSGLNQEL